MPATRLLEGQIDVAPSRKTRHGESIGNASTTQGVLPMIRWTRVWRLSRKAEFMVSHREVI